MYQLFYSDTLGSRFIKSLLRQTRLPIYDCYVNGDPIIPGVTYYNKGNIVRGSTVEGSSDAVLSPLYTFDSSVLQDTTTFESTTNYYDPETHYHLGRYLRYLHSSTGLNLMPYYNCYNGTLFNDLELKRSEDKDTNRITINAVRTSKPNYKVIGVPILFNKEYTIAIDCPTEVLACCCFYEHDGLLTEEVLDKHKSTDGKTAKTLIANSGKSYPGTSFIRPVKYTISCENKEFFPLQKCLYLLLQVPINNDSSVVVLENFVSRKSIVNCEKNIEYYKYDENRGEEQKVVVINNALQRIQSENSLLHMNYHATYAFSDRLIEYLLKNVIHTDDIAQNIAKVQTAFAENNSGYKDKFLNKVFWKGFWDEDLSNLVIDLVNTYAKENLIYDQDGFINKDVESILNKKGYNY